MSLLLAWRESSSHQVNQNSAIKGRPHESHAAAFGISRRRGRAL